MKNFFIIDNRRPVRSGSFEDEAALSNYTRNVFWTLAQYVVMSESSCSEWVPAISAVAVAATSSTSRVLPASRCDCSSLLEAVQLKETVSNEQQTWAFCSDALKKLFTMVPTDRPPGTGHDIDGIEGIVTIISPDYAFSTDACQSAYQQGITSHHSSDASSRSGAVPLQDPPGDGRGGCSQSPEATFSRLVQQFVSRSHFAVRLVCVQVGLVPQPLHFHAPHAHASTHQPAHMDSMQQLREMQLLFQSIKAGVHALSTAPTPHNVTSTAGAAAFNTSIIANSSIHFEQELKMLLQLLARPLMRCVLSFDPPSQAGPEGGRRGPRQLKVQYSLTPMNTDGCKALARHRASRDATARPCFQQSSRTESPPTPPTTNGLQHASLFSLTPRASLHPACIKGNTMLVLPCSTGNSNTSTSGRNALFFSSLTRYLAEGDLLLVVKTPAPAPAPLAAFAGGASTSSEFWCFIPPPAPLEKMAMHDPATADATASQQYSSMYLMQLQDNEGMVYCGSGGSGAAGGVGEKLLESEAPFDGSVASSTTPAPLGDQHHHQQQQQQQQMVMEFLHQSIAGALGHGAAEASAPDCFNPLIAVSDSLNAEISTRMAREGALRTERSNQGRGNPSSRPAPQYQPYQPIQPTPSAPGAVAGVGQRGRNRPQDQGPRPHTGDKENPSHHSSNSNSNSSSGSNSNSRTTSATTSNKAAAGNTARMAGKLQVTRPQRSSGGGGALGAMQSSGIAASRGRRKSVRGASPMAMHDDKDIDEEEDDIDL